MSEYGVVTEPRTVRLERTLPGPIELVWEYLVDSDKRRTWLAWGPIEPRVGGKVSFDWKNSQLSKTVEPVPAKYQHTEVEGGAHLDALVTVYEPPHKLGITWGPESDVLFELTPKGEDVQLVLTHRRLPNRDELISVSSGWHAHLAILLDKLRGEEPRPFWSTHAVLEAEYERRIGA